MSKDENFNISSKRETEVDQFVEGWSSTDKRQPCPVFDGMKLPSFPALQKDCEKRMKDIFCLNSQETDIIICTYPKSGTHWSSEIVGILLSGQEQLLTTMKIHTMLEAVFDLDKLDEIPKPRILDSHLPLRFLPKKHIDNNYKLIHVIRNPKDLMVSYYNHACRDPCVGPVGTWDEYFNQFLSGDVPYGSWFSYVKQFEKQFQNHENSLLVYYESLHKDPRNSIQKIADFVSVQTTPEYIDRIIDVTSFENMSRNKVDFTRDVTPDGKGFVYRKGVIGDWKNYFTEEQNRIFNERFAREMKDSSYKFIFEE